MMKVSYLLMMQIRREMGSQCRIYYTLSLHLTASLSQEFFPSCLTELLEDSETYPPSLISYSPVKPLLLVLRAVRLLCGALLCVFPSRSLDLSETLGLPGVVDVVTEEHLQDVNSCFLTKPEKLLGSDEVLHCCFCFKNNFLHNGTLCFLKDSIAFGTLWRIPIFFECLLQNTIF